MERYEWLRAAVSSSLLTFTCGTFQSDSIIIGTFGEAGVLASAVDGYVMYRNADGAEWNTRDCLIDITRNEENSDGEGAKSSKRAERWDSRMCA